ncbi:hypothetical protein BG011_009434 [Mortierella polycephala]|uniref:Amino acid transporter transmembrane domain-containing protein n=1 Tax=Mortierella polycephala TaxID=41804 RepID=A0A9P6PPD6_9FUNG|nr:hypothetical protein BG011_009434 [Mortierella polycephala]
MSNPPSLAGKTSSVDQPVGSCSILEVSFNILNCTVGSGILALAFAIKESGFGLGIILSMLVAVLCWLSLYILIVTGQRIGVYKYAMLCEATMGALGFYLLNGIIFFQTAGACITYMIVIGDTIPIMLDILGFQVSRKWVIFISSLLFILPLLFYRSIGSLARVSIVSVMLLPPILFAVAVRGFEYAPDHKRTYNFVGDNVFPAIGVMAFAMLSAQTAFLNFTTLKTPTRKAWGQATGVAVSLSWVISFVFAIIGFFSFGDDVQPNIFNSFPPTDGLINFGRFLLGLSMFLTFPQAFYPARAAIHKILGHEDNFLDPTDKEHYYTTIGLFIPILACGVFIADLGLLYQLIGGFCSTFLAYIIPGLCYFLVFWGGKGSRQPSELQGRGDGDNEEEEAEQGEDRYDDDEDSLEDDEHAMLPEDEEVDRLMKKKLCNNNNSKSDLAQEERAEPLDQSHVNIYGSTIRTSPSIASSSSSSSDLDGKKTRRRKRYEGHKTETWLDVAAGMLLVIGLFVMVISTTLTLKKMLGFA